MKLSKLSTRTTPASCPLSASFIAANVSAFGTSSKAALLEIGESETILTPFIRERTFFNCSNKDGLSICNVNCAITLIFIFAAKIRVFCETTKFLVEFLIHGSILADFWDLFGNMKEKKSKVFALPIEELFLFFSDFSNNTELSHVA